LEPGQDSRSARQRWVRSAAYLQAIADAPFERGDSWPEPLVRRMDDGLPGRVDMLKCYGNGIVPPQAAEFIIAACEAAAECTLTPTS
jgi:DNA (cytosine-5)-methyltransferase 1